MGETREQSSLGMVLGIALGLAIAALLAVAGGVAFIAYRQHRVDVDRELDVALAAAVSEAQPLPATEDLFINIDREGTYIVDQQAMTNQELEAFLRTKVVGQPALAVKIRPDGDGPAKAAIDAFEVCSKVGIRDVALVAQADN